ncbi:MAG: rod shape-determining protein RodA [Anaerolineaceae bacterium 4572_78]|nr:MAG: rod shape-determining protein RodA [Anaerolineaceae bacterium 4572_78]
MSFSSILPQKLGYQIEVRIWRKFDILMLGIVIILILFGIAMIASATKTTIDMQELWWTQLTRACMGLVILVILASIDYRYYGDVYKFLYIFILILLGVLLIVGEITGGTQRWLAGGAIQPGELTKLIMIICLAKFLSNHDSEIKNFAYFFFTLIMVALPIILIFLQPDLGTSIIIGFIWFVMAIVAGMRLFHVGLLTSAGVLTFPLFWLVMQEYMRRRITLFLNPAGNPDDYYNVQQALISIGSGGLLGKGYGLGTQNQLRFLRVRHTDFLFSVITEELGLIGAFLLVLLLALLLWRILRAALMTQDRFGQYICVGVAAVIFFQSFVNIGVNLGIMPVTGTPLPFISYGGSSLLTFLLAIGLVQSVLMHQHGLEFG